MSEENQESKRGPGRPKKHERPLIPWKKIDTLIVFGEEIVNENGDTVVFYPSYRELADQFGVAHSLIAAYSERRACIPRRHDAEARAKALAESEIIERRAADLAISTEDALKIIDLSIVEFGKALNEGRARVDTVADLNTLLRLKQLLLGGADTRQEVVHGLSLEDLQQKHQAMLQVIAETSAADRRDGSRILIEAKVKSNSEDDEIEHDDPKSPDFGSLSDVQDIPVQFAHTAESPGSDDELTSDMDTVGELVSEYELADNFFCSEPSDDE